LILWETEDQGPLPKAWLKRRSFDNLTGHVSHGDLWNAMSAASSGRSRINIKALTI
jgi:hypothetical protein